MRHDDAADIGWVHNRVDFEPVWQMVADRPLKPKPPDALLEARHRAVWCESLDNTWQTRAELKRRWGGTTGCVYYRIHALQRYGLVEVRRRRIAGSKRLVMEWRRK